MVSSGRSWDSQVWGTLSRRARAASQGTFESASRLGEGRALADAIGGRSVAEGVRSSRPVVDLAARLGVEVPVAEQVVAVCYGGHAPLEGVASLMGRAPRSEFDTVSRHIEPGAVR